MLRPLLRKHIKHAQPFIVSHEQQALARYREGQHTSDRRRRMGQKTRAKVVQANMRR